VTGMWPLRGEFGTIGEVVGEIGVAFVVPADPVCPAARDALRARTRQHLADYKAPDRVEILSELPPTSMLKTDRDALRALARSDPRAP
jgi:acyl-coenzyme A synthetase/AMP-(fatty) acid ligase